MKVFIVMRDEYTNGTMDVTSHVEGVFKDKEAVYAFADKKQLEYKSDHVYITPAIPDDKYLNELDTRIDECKKEETYD